MGDVSDSKVVCAAFSAGWSISQLHGPILGKKGTAETSDLPTINELSGDDRLKLSFRELDKFLRNDLQGVLGTDQASQDISELIEGLDDARVVDELRNDIARLHCSLLEALVVAGHNYGTAYMLGRSLSDTCSLVTSIESLLSEFNRYRIANIQGWLSDTAAVFPEFSARVVSISLDKWVDWASENANLQWEIEKTHVERALRIQGEHWRAILSGDRDPRSLLSTDGYIAAAEIALGRAELILRRVAARFWIPLVVALSLTAAAAYVSITYGAGTAKVWAFAVSVATGLGVTGKGMQVAAKRLVVNAGESLFSTSEEEVISAEILWLPYLNESRTGNRKLHREGIIERPSLM